MRFPEKREKKKPARPNKSWRFFDAPSVTLLPKVDVKHAAVSFIFRERQKKKKKLKKKKEKEEMLLDGPDCLAASCVLEGWKLGARLAAGSYWAAGGMGATLTTDWLLCDVKAPSSCSWLCVYINIFSKSSGGLFLIMCKLNFGWEPISSYVIKVSF